MKLKQMSLDLIAKFMSIKSNFTFSLECTFNTFCKVDNTDQGPLKPYACIGTSWYVLMSSGNIFTISQSPDVVLLSPMSWKKLHM